MSQGLKRSKPYDESLLEFAATEAQAEAYRCYGKHGSNANAAAGELEKSPSYISRSVLAIQKRAAEAGHTALEDLSGHVPEGYHVKGKSLLLDGDGQVKQQWLKTDKDRQQQEEDLKNFIEGLTSKIKPAKKIPASRKHKNKDLLPCIFIGDGHLGMRAYSPETKHSDFDSDIASQGLRDAIDDLVDRSPDAETGLLVDVGDFMHADTAHNKTFAGTDVDVDTRHERVLEIAGEVMQYAIIKMLAKFKYVTVVIAKGNHNPTAAVAIAQITKAYFRNNDRVSVLKTIGFFHYIEWGKWLIGVNHGDKIKAPKLVNVMARDMPEAWGRSTHRMWATGHFHHEQVLELDGCTVYKFGALPPPDSWHTSMGFGGDGQMQMMVLRREGGKHSTIVYDMPRPRIEPDAVIA
jgi:hypothetical protein